MNRYYVDLEGISSREMLHDRLTEALGLPDYYGRNLDALFDILTEMSGRIWVFGQPEAEEELAGYIDSTRQTIAEAAEENPQLTAAILE